MTTRRDPIRRDPIEVSIVIHARNASRFARTTRPLQILALALGTTLAIAQPVTDLPRSTIETISVNGGQRTQIEQFVNNWLPRLTSENASDNKRALEALTTPLHGRGVSIAFRQSYSQLLIPTIDELINDRGIQGKINALRISGDLATPAASARIRRLLNDDDAGVRLFAVASAGRLFQSAGVHGPAITDSDASALINAILENARSNTDDAEYTHACARAFVEATTIPTRDLTATRSNAIIALSDLVGEHLSTLDADEDPKFVQGLALDASSATTVSISDISATINADAARAAVRLGADVIALPLRRVIAKTIEPQGERDLTVRSVQAGETLLYFARRKGAELGGRSSTGIDTTSFSDLLKSGNDRDFRNQAAALLAPGGTIDSNYKFGDRFLN
jgi:hypothetical protein